MLTVLCRALLAALAIPPLLTTVNAQCGPLWLPGAAAPGPFGTVLAVLPLPNGEIVAGGLFPLADGVVTNNVARWDGVTWRAMGAGANNMVTCLARLPNGDIVAGGAFTTMGGQSCARIARWNGASWSPLGTGFDAAVSALAVLPNGDLVASGSFTLAGSLVVNNIARWNGQAWSTVGPTFFYGLQGPLAVRPNGDVIAVAGLFFVSQVVRWDGASWTAIGDIDVTINSIDALTTLANGNVAISGEFAVAGVPTRVAIWNGVATQPVPAPPIGLPSLWLGAANGDLVVAGVGPAGPAMARWDGTTWIPIAGSPRASALAEDASGRLIVGSNHQVPGGSHSVVRQEPSGWRGLGAPVPPLVSDILRLGNEDVVVGGHFASFGGIAASNLSRWNGSAWSPLGAGVNGPVHALASAPNGDLLVGGGFLQAGGAPAQRIARWNGSAWSTLGSGLVAAPTALAVAAGGDVFALASDGTLSRFHNLVWSSLPLPGGQDARSLAALPNGDIVIGASRGFDAVLIYRAATATVSPIAGSPPWVQQVIVDASGTLLTAGGAGVHSWNGVNWTTLRTSAAQSLTRLPNGDLLVSGSPQSFAGSATASTAYRLGAGGWTGFAALSSSASRLAATDRGEVFAAGPFATVEGAVSVGFASVRATCPATAQIVGSGCSGAAGPLTLQADNRPWIGGLLRTRALGLTANSLALQLVSVQATQVPLPSGAAGCSLFGVPLFSSLLVPNGGTAAGSLVVPPQPSLTGLQFRLQVVGVELGPTGIVRFTSTNALQLTVGSL